MRRGQNKNQRRVRRTDDRTPCSPRRPPMRAVEWWCLRLVYVNREKQHDVGIVTIPLPDDKRSVCTAIVGP